MGSARVKKKGRRKLTAKLTVQTVPAVPKVEQPHGGALNLGGTPGHRGAGGRPPNAWRDHARVILDEDGAAAAREILQGNPDKAGRIPDQALRMRLIESLTAIGFNEPMRKAKLESDATAAASGKPGAQAGVQIILHGGPLGNERVDAGT